MKVAFVSLGCDKNLVDSQQMMGYLKGTGDRYTLTDDESEADAAVVNTCAFIDSAKQESIDNILEIARYKKTGHLKALVVTGCMAQRYHDEILKELPEVDAVVGTTAEDSLPAVLDRIFAGEKANEPVLQDVSRAPAADVDRVLTIGSHVGYLKIAEGCDKCCSYCAIPMIRGHYRSVPMEKLVADAKRLVSLGARELILVAQETTLYGTDLYGEKKLPELLRRLCLISGVKWIRVLYCYPEEITMELVQTMKEEKKILPYIDMPVQHASDRILKRMGRRTTRRELEAMVQTLRREIPDICIRTTLISGFPGETEEDHRELLSFVKKMKFDRLGVYTYSREEGTPAAKFDGQVHPGTREHRRRELMLAQQEIAFHAAGEQVGTTLETVIEGRLPGKAPDGRDVYAGRTYRDIPDVDSNIFVATRRDLLSGEFVDVKVTGTDGYDLTGEIDYHESSE